jgi:hypothetical protein
LNLPSKKAIVLQAAKVPAVVRIVPLRKNLLPKAKAPAIARMLPANRALLLKVKVPEKGTELRALQMANRIRLKAGEVRKAGTPERVRAHLMVKVPAREQVLTKVEKMPGVRAEGKTEAQIPKQDCGCSRQSSELFRIRYHN